MLVRVKKEDNKYSRFQITKYQKKGFSWTKTNKPKWNDNDNIYLVLRYKRVINVIQDDRRKSKVIC